MIGKSCVCTQLLPNSDMGNRALQVDRAPRTNVVQVRVNKTRPNLFVFISFFLPLLNPSDAVSTWICIFPRYP